MIPEVDKKFDHWATPALGDLKKASWNIKMLSKNKSLILTIDNLVALHEKAITETRRFHLEKDFEFSFDPEKLQEEIAALRETFLIETRNEVIHWF